MRLTLTSFLIGLTVVGFLLFGILSFVQPLAVQTNINGYSNKTIAMSFDENISTIVDSTGASLSNASTTPSVFDIIGNFINTAWTAVKAPFVTMSVFNQFANQAVSEVEEQGVITGLSQMRNTLFIILGILLFIGFAAYFLTGRET
jgi:O-antigen/teichoic acid export membrane protein